MASTNDLKNGLVLNLEGQLWSVVEFQHVKPGKGPAFVRTKLKHVLTGKVVDKTFNAGIKVDTATVDRREMTYLYQDGNQFVFMDGDTYEQIHIDGDVVGGQLAVPAGEPERGRRHARGRAAVHRAADVGRAGHQADRPGPAGRPLHRRHQAGHAGDRRGDPGAAVPVDRREGQGRHPRRPLPRPRQLLDGRAQQGTQARGRRAVRGGAARRRPADPARRAHRGRPSTRRPNDYATALLEGVVAHRERIDELLDRARRGLDAGPDAVRGRRGPAARRVRAAVGLGRAGPGGRRRGRPAGEVPVHGRLAALRQRRPRPAGHDRRRSCAPPCSTASRRTRASENRARSSVASLHRLAAMGESVDRRSLLAAGVTVLLWASAFVAIRDAGEHFSPGALAFGRLLAGSVVLVVVLLVRREGCRRARRGRASSRPACCGSASTWSR